jgi:5-formyltetrahydrofolate cyclo-ligase
MADKNEIRRHLRLEMRRRRAAFNDPARSMAVRGIMANLASLLWPLRDANIHVYLAFTDEVNLHPFYQKLLDSGANLYTSKIAAGGQLSHHRLERLDDLQEGKLGVPVPRHPGPAVDAAYDWIIVPGLVFDPYGHRLGYGRGYYDRFLGGIEGQRIGVCFAFQIIDELPVAKHDQAMDYLISEAGISETNRGLRPPVG